MALIGYARVSRTEQNLELQVDTLKEKGCTKIFTDKITGTNFERKELTAALAFLRNGDVLVVWKLERVLQIAGVACFLGMVWDDEAQSIGVALKHFLPIPPQEAPPRCTTLWMLFYPHGIYLLQI